MKNTTDTILAAIARFQAVRATLRVFPYKVPMPYLKRLSMGLKNEDAEKAVSELLEDGTIDRSKCLNYDSYGVKDFKKENAMTHFENAIKEYLDARAKEDVKFAEKYSNGKKSIEECCRFILGEMKKKAAGGMYGATDAEVFGLAVHYYDEEGVKVEKNVSAEVVINRELTEEEKLQLDKSKEARKKKETEAMIEEDNRRREELRKREAEDKKRKEQERKKKVQEEEGLLFLFDEEDL
jgi:hypothetical protein|nr:MAG TPA: PcfK-like protein [Caudoviricetes sp.]